MDPPSLLDVRWSLAGPPARPAALDGTRLPRRPHSRCRIRRSRARASRCARPGRAPSAARPGTPAGGAASGRGPARGIRWWSTTPARARPPPGCGGRCGGSGTTTVAVLDGGFAGWARAGRPIEPGEATPPAGRHRRPARAACRCSTPTAAARWSRPTGVLLDCPGAGPRTAASTEPIDPVAGHIPGAVNLPAARLVDRDGHDCARPTSCGEIFAEAGVGAGPVGAYCGSGVTAARHGARPAPWPASPTRPSTSARGATGSPTPTVPIATGGDA